MSEFSKELAELPFEQVLGGPLMAMLDAMKHAAKSTIEFIQEVGFDPPMVAGMQFAVQGPAPQGQQGPGGAPGAMDPSMAMQAALSGSALGRAKTVKFQYERVLPDGSVGVSHLTIPLLCMVPVPFLRIETMEVSFNAKLSLNISSHSEGSDIMTSDSKYKRNRFKLTGNFADIENRKDDTTFSVEYGIKVNLKATSDELPSGIQRLLDIVEKGISEQAAEAVDARRAEEAAKKAEAAGEQAGK
mmetsp:Transcript_45255/g.113923  ORF Transcript_45255/g.113923 Transcript_45255/m.113923 type:complete len:244 (+) Transcript_45255:258-989(+)